jgi:hypothetical protein
VGVLGPRRLTRDGGDRVPDTTTDVAKVVAGDGSEFFLHREFERATSAGVAFAPEFVCDARMDQFITKHAAQEERGLPLPLPRCRAAEQRAVSQCAVPGRRSHPRLRGLDTITTRKHPAQGRPVKAFNPVARPDYQLFVALMSGEHAVHGFANRDLRAKLIDQLRDDPKQQSAQISRLVHRLHVCGLVAKIPRSRRWRVTAFGHRVMSASVRLRQLHFPALYAEAEAA